MCIYIHFFSWIGVLFVYLFCFAFTAILLFCAKSRVKICVQKCVYDVRNAKIICECVYVYLCINNTEKVDFETLCTNLWRYPWYIVIWKKLLSNVYISFIKVTWNIHIKFISFKLTFQWVLVPLPSGDTIIINQF